MEYIYSAMLLHKAGKEITEDAVKKVLEAAGVAVDDARVKALIASLEDVNIDKAIEKAAVPVAAVPATAEAPAGGEASKEGKEKPKKDPKEEKKSEEAAAAGLGALFG